MSVEIDLQLLQESLKTPSTSAYAADLISKLKLIQDIVKQNTTESGQRAKKFYNEDTETPQITVGSKSYYIPMLLNQAKVQEFG